jgi:hypothetical protein
VDLLGGRVSPKHKGHPNSLGFLVSSLGFQVLYDSAVGPSSQARDTGCSGEEKRAESNLRRSDYLEKKKLVL